VPKFRREAVSRLQHYDRQGGAGRVIAGPNSRWQAEPDPLMMVSHFGLSAIF
jgi:hypothetical protein